MSLGREKSASVLSIIGTVLLSNHRVMDLLKSTSFRGQLDKRRLREAVYLGYQPWAARYPDHVFDQNWKKIQTKSSSTFGDGLINPVLNLVSQEFFEIAHGSLHVKEQKFSAWQQSIVSRMSGLPLQAAMYMNCQSKTYLYLPGSKKRLWDDSPNWADRNVPVSAPYDPLVEEYLNREGLNETHLHLNGSTHAELCWLRALYTPKNELRDFCSKWNARSEPTSITMKELVRSINPELSPNELHSQIVVAGKLREWLIAAATNSLSDDTILPFDYSALLDKTNVLKAPAPADQRFILSQSSSSADELIWMMYLLKRLNKKPSNILERMFHLYIVIQNQYYRLLVQSEDQFGFDQFQKFTFTELREPAEKDYLARFSAMHGKQRNISRTGYLEGRFAPKKTLKKNYSLLKSILSGYNQYLEGVLPSNTAQRSHNSLTGLLNQLEHTLSQRPPHDRSLQKLTLVAHFIKQPWNPGKKAGPYRFYNLRKQLEDNANVLIKTMDRWPKLQMWIRGIDAAANELHAPPEVFASCYRVCLHAGLTHRSYHVGEDFPHLLTGLRTMHDALELLDLRNGDRIGHGTAMGILPSLWLDRMPEEIVINKSEWMLDLLFSWQFLREIPELTHEAVYVSSELSKYLSEVFQQDISCHQFESAMSLRGLNIRYLQKKFESNSDESLMSLNDFWDAEAKRVDESYKREKQHLELLWQWLSDKELWKRSEEQIVVNASFLNSSCYLRLQQKLMQCVAERKVIIETLPSSNVRISQYFAFSEHHSLRWMGVPGFKQEDDPEIMVSLGSDDPGIFASDLNAEFYHLYAALRNQGLGDKAALNFIAPINERGREYRFHDPILG